MEGTAKRYWTTDEVDERVQQKTKELLEQLKQLKEDVAHFKNAYLGKSQENERIRENWDKAIQSQMLALHNVKDEEIKQLKEENERLLGGIKKYVHHMERFFGEPKVGQPPSLQDLKDLLD